VREGLSAGLNRWERFNLSLSLWFERIAILGMVGIILATIIDVVGAKFFHWPLPAGTEVVYFLQVIAIAGALAISKIDGRHIRLEFVDNLPKSGRALFHILASLLGLGLFIILCWTSFEYAQSLRINSEVTSTARIVVYPFALWLALCCLPMVLILIKELISALVEIISK
jgi:TRAP-type C4-dicarboxylate transport system permease small subunit